MENHKIIEIEITPEQFKRVIENADEYFNLHIEDLKKIRSFTDLDDVKEVLDKLFVLYKERLDRIAECEKKDLSLDDLGLYIFTVFVKSEAVKAGLLYFRAIEDMKIVGKESIQ